MVFRSVKKFSTIRPKRRIAISAALVCIAIASSACSSSSGGGSSSSSANGSSGSYQIVDVSDLTGAVGSYGVAAVAGVEFAVDQINAAGGVNGKKLKLAQPIDSQSTPAGYQSGLRTAFGANPIAIFGHTSATDLTASLSILNQAGIPYFSTAGPTDQLLAEKWYYTVNASIGSFAGGMLSGTRQALGGSLQGKKVGLVTVSQSAFYVAVTSALQDSLREAGATLSPVEETQTVVPTFAAQAAQMVANHPDAIMVQVNTNDSVVTVIKALLAAGYHGKIIGAETASTDAILQTINNAQFTGVRTGTIPDPGTQLGNAARKADVQADALSNDVFSMGFASVYGLKAALEKCGAGCNSPQQLLKAIPSVGQVTAPLGALNGPMDFSRHDASTYEQAWRWDGQTDSAVAAGPPFNTLSA